VCAPKIYRFIVKSLEYNKITSCILSHTLYIIIATNFLYYITLIFFIYWHKSLNYSQFRNLIDVSTLIFFHPNLFKNTHETHREKNLVVSIRILVDSTSISFGKWTNQNSCRNYQMNLINFFLLNLSNFLVNNTKLTSTKSSKMFSI